MAAPGGLTELGDAVQAWEARVGEVAAAVDPPSHLLLADADNASELRIVDWPAAPARIRACLGRERADRVIDARDAESGDVGRRQFQEEYAEWRVVRDQGGPTAFELTTELADYWELLAAHQPQTVLDLIGRFAGEPVDPAAIFGRLDPAGMQPEERRKAFRETMVRRAGPYNNGLRAITCLTRHDNSLSALVNLVAAAASPQLVIDTVNKEARFPSASEAIPTLRPRSAQDCRNSDPVVVERVVRLATEGRLIRFDDPIGIYILAFQSHDLLTPDGQPLPSAWFELSRQKPSPDGLPRNQRLTVRKPQDADFALSEVRARRTGSPITHGAQIAELIELGVYIRVSERGAIPVQVAPRGPQPMVPCAERPDCAAERRLADELMDAAP